MWHSRPVTARGGGEGAAPSTHAVWVSGGLPAPYPPTPTPAGLHAGKVTVVVGHPAHDELPLAVPAGEWESRGQRETMRGEGDRRNPPQVTPTSLPSPRHLCEVPRKQTGVGCEARSPRHRRPQIRLPRDGDEVTGWGGVLSTTRGSSPRLCPRGAQRLVGVHVLIQRRPRGPGASAQGALGSCVLQ